MRTNEEKLEWILDPKTKKRLYFICNRYGRGEFAGDVFQEYCAMILEGKSQKQTLDEFFKDYSRKHGWSGIKSKYKFLSIDDKSLDIPMIEKRDTDISEHLFFGISDDRRAILLLAAKWGMTGEEIGEVLNISKELVWNKVSTGELYRKKHDGEYFKKIASDTIDSLKRRLFNQKNLTEKIEKTLSSEILKIKEEKIEKTKTFNIAEMEKILIQNALKLFSTREEAAKMLGISARTLRNKIAIYRKEK